ncbi:MAG: DUF3530 family protein [Gammaproteobacteria bacterium]|nr:DUF3530 family protein [Gammaproteobacteria bacterium]
MKKWMLCLLAGCLLTLARADENTDSTAESSELAAETGDASTAPEPVERPALRSWSNLQLLRLQQTYPDEYRPLTAGDLGAGALYLPANRAPARGWVILLPGYRQPADTADTLDLLRRQLPDAGWHSLSLQLPDPEFMALRVSAPPVPPADSDEQHDDENSSDSPVTDDSGAEHTDTSPEGEPDETGSDLPEAGQSDPEPLASTAQDTPEPPASYETVMHTLLDAALQMAREQQGPLILLGQREGAYWLLHTACNLPAPPDALILLHPAQPGSGLPEDAASLEALAGACKLPVTDYYAPAAAGTAKRRLDASKRNPDSRYLQVVLREPVAPLQQNEALRRIKGRLILFDSGQ